MRKLECNGYIHFLDFGNGFMGLYMSKHIKLYTLSMFYFLYDDFILKLQEKKGIQIGNEEVKWSLLADNMMIYIENAKYSTKQLLE